MQDPPPPPELKDPVRWTKTRLVAGIQGQWGPSQTNELKVLERKKLKERMCDN